MTTKITYEFQYWNKSTKEWSAYRSAGDDLAAARIQLLEEKKKFVNQGPKWSKLMGSKIRLVKLTITYKRRVVETI